MRTRRPEREETSALDLIEEAAHLLRLAPASTLLVYYVGAFPFVLALLFFWSDMSRSAFAESHLAGSAIGLAVLFIWMKTWQVIFAANLRAQLAREPSPRWNTTLLLKITAQQTLIQSLGLVLLPAAAFIFFPLAWTVAFFHNVTALGAKYPHSTSTLLKRSWHEAFLDGIQNHSVLTVLFLFGTFVFIDLALTVVAIPWLLKLLFGLETAFTLSITSVVNTTFFAVIFGLSYLCLDPLFKAVYVLRCFYGESRKTGEDLRVSLRSVTSQQLVAMVILLVCVGTFSAHAADEAPKTAPGKTRQINPSELSYSIDEVLKKPEYSWRGPRNKIAKHQKQTTESTFWTRVEEWLRNLTQGFRDYWNKLFGPRTPQPGVPLDFSLFSRKGLLFVLIVLLGAIIGVLLFLLWRTRQRSHGIEVTPQPTAAVPDLHDESIGADELPEDGWLRLGLELLDRGEVRLALRSFYLASLAHLASRDLIRIAKFKSNRDYERELLRRSHALPDLSSAFSENVSVFDAVWYGRHDIDDEVLQRFRLNAERIKSC